MVKLLNNHHMCFKYIFTKNKMLISKLLKKYDTNINLSFYYYRLSFIVCF